jgi:hypothetical protein
VQAERQTDEARQNTLSDAPPVQRKGWGSGVFLPCHEATGELNGYLLFKLWRTEL